MPDTPDTQQIRDDILEMLDAEGLDPEDRKEKGQEVASMNYAELVSAYPNITPDD